MALWVAESEAQWLRMLSIPRTYVVVEFGESAFARQRQLGSSTVTNYTATIPLLQRNALHFCPLAADGRSIGLFRSLVVRASPAPPAKHTEWRCGMERHRSAIPHVYRSPMSHACLQKAISWLASPRSLKEGPGSVPESPVLIPCPRRRPPTRRV